MPCIQSFGPIIVLFRHIYFVVLKASLNDIDVFNVMDYPHKYSTAQRRIPAFWNFWIRLRLLHVNLGLTGI